MLNQHGKLLVRNKTSEREIRGLVNVRLAIRPLDTVSLREQLPHEILLASHGNLDKSVADPAGATSSRILQVTLDRANGVARRLKLDVNVQRLSGDAAHDDVDGLHVVG